MKLGLLTAPFPDTPARSPSPTGRSPPASRRWRSPAGRARPAPTRRYAGTSHIDVASLSAAEASDIVAALAERGLAISGARLLPEPAAPRPAPTARR